MLLKSIPLLFFLIVFSSISISKEDSLIVAKNMNVYCDQNYYSFDIMVDINPPIKDPIPFILEPSKPESLRYKCVIDGNERKISCLFLDHYFPTINDDTVIIFPETFPVIKGIAWDYNSFIRYIWGKVWDPRTLCLDKEEGNNIITKSTLTNYDLIFEINEISGGKCLSMKNKNFINNFVSYDFEMKVKIKIEQISKNYNVNEIQIIQEIWMPIYLKDENIKEEEIAIQNYKKENINNNETINNISIEINETEGFSNENYYHLAFCSLTDKLYINNYKSTYEFKCTIPVNEKKVLNGPFFIKPFIDQGIINLLPEGKGTFKGHFRFKLQKGKYLFLNDNPEEEYLCPDKVILRVDTLKSMSFLDTKINKDKFTFMFESYLTNGYEKKKKKLVPLSSIKKEIDFPLQMTDNLAEKTEENKIEAQCKIKPGTNFTVFIDVHISCVGEKKYQSDKFTDVSINTGLDINRNFDNLLIIWPEKKKRKHLYYYDIEILAFRKTEHGCFDDRYYFYLDIVDLGKEPINKDKIIFGVALAMPSQQTAICKINDPTSLKCYVDLKYNTLKKKKNLILKPNITAAFKDEEGNMVNTVIKVNDYLTNLYSYVLEVKEDCGYGMVMGTLKDMGYSKVARVIIIVVTIVIFSIIILLVYILIMNRFIGPSLKNKYIKQVDEVAPKTNVTLGVKDPQPAKNEDQGKPENINKEGQSQPQEKGKN